MKRDELESHLDRGEEWGVRKETGSRDYLGWVLVSKHVPPAVGPFDPREEPAQHDQWKTWAERQRSTPYHVTVIELRREVHECGDYESNEDYRLRESYDVGSLAEVEQLFERFGFSLGDLKHRNEIDAP